MKNAICFALLLLLSLFVVSRPALATEAVGQVVVLAGTASSESSGNLRQLQKGSPIYSGETLKTAENSYLSARFSDGATVLMRPGSIFTVAEYRYLAVAHPTTPVAAAATVTGKGSNALLRFVKGGFRVVSGLIGKVSRENHRILTPVATIGIRGTDFTIDVAEDTTSRIGVTEGAVDVANVQLPENIVRVDAGYFTVVRPLLPPDPALASDGGESGQSGSLGALERAEDALVESAELPASDRFLAFANPLFDAFDNPAYASSSYGSEGLLSLAASGYSSSSMRSTGASSRTSGTGFSGHLAKLHRLDGNYWLGLSATGQLARDELPDSNNAAATLKADTSRESASALAAHQSGRWSLGIGGSFYRSDLRNDQLFAAAGIPPVSARSENRITELQLGAVRDATSASNLGFGFTQQFVENRTRTNTGLQKNLQGTSQAVELRWRQPVQPQLFLGALLRARLSESAEQVNDTNGPFYDEDIRIQSYQGGLGLGFVPNASTALVGDLTVGYSVERALQRFTNGSVREDEHDQRLSAALHLGTQLHLPYHLLFTLDATQQFIRDDKRFVFVPGTSAARTLATSTNSNALQARASIAYSSGRYLFGYLAASNGITAQPVVHNLFLIVSW